MSTVLDMMKRLRTERLMPVHPMQGMDRAVRFPYMVGVVMVAQADGELAAEKRVLLEELALSIGIDDQFTQILNTATTVTSETVVTIIDALDTKEQQYAFILDLHNVAWWDGQAGQTASEMVAVFADLLKLNLSEQEFLQTFAAAVRNGEIEKAQTAVDVAGKKGIELPATVLKYFLPEIEKRTNSAEMEKGDVRIVHNLQKDCFEYGEEYARRINQMPAVNCGNIHFRKEEKKITI